MSTYYYMACDKCRERVACASRIVSGSWVGLSIKGSPNAMNSVAVWDFLDRHSLCIPDVRLRHEHEDEIYEYRELTADECKEPRE